MLPKRQKLVKGKSASMDANSNHSIVSMFAKQLSHNSLKNVPLDKQDMNCQVMNLSEFIDKPSVNNRLSLRRKRLCTADKVNGLSDDTDTINISGPSCRPEVTPLSENMSDAMNDMQNDFVHDTSLMSAENTLPHDIFDSSNQQRYTNFTVNQQGTEEISSHRDSELTVDENSVCYPSPVKPNDNDTDDGKATRVPYYLESFLLVLDTVFKDTFYADLFNEDDLSTLDAFKSLSGNVFQIKLLTYEFYGFLFGLIVH